MKKKSNAWVPVFVTNSPDSIRVGLAGNASLPNRSTSPWHEFFFGAEGNSNHPQQNPKLHTNTKR